ncbi:hypothetical protein KIN20_012375 [Parelaphostrongylus tenuis]|uniref:Uncharacterized protein n=1 Tax=Parelaphostrongylus tenuis TaxID=148309 RepID=A0AAD5ME48_PARTN|nr:hypothetical protein KIN20_012375 [Parelaphostrongylus tenuis]
MEESLKLARKIATAIGYDCGTTRHSDQLNAASGHRIDDDPMEQYQCYMMDVTSWPRLLSSKCGK